MVILKYIHNKIGFLLAGILIMSLLSSCGIYAPSDARKVSPNSKERVKKNLEEGKGFSFGKINIFRKTVHLYLLINNDSRLIYLGDKVQTLRSRNYRTVN